MIKKEKLKEEESSLNLDQLSNDLDDILGIKEIPDAEESIPIADDLAVNEEPMICPLSLDNVPPVADMDHYTGRCLCYMCTCGKHICPGLIANPIIPSKAFKSSNNVDYSPSKHWRASRAQKAREEQ